MRHNEGNPEKLWSNRLQGIDHPRRAVDACEIVIRSAKGIIVERSLKAAPGWRVSRDGDEAPSFIAVEEAVHLSVPALVDLVTERLAAARSAG